MNRKYLFGVALVVLVMVLAATAYTARSTTEATTGVETPWNFDGVDNIGDVGRYASVAIAPDTGRTYISYYDATNMVLKIATHIGSGGNCGPDDAWSCQVVDDGSDDLNGDALNDNVGSFSSIAISPTTKLPSIAYVDTTNSALKLAVKVPKIRGWKILTIQDLDTTGLFIMYTSLAIDSSGGKHIAYYQSNASGNDSLWYVESLDWDAGVGCDHNFYNCKQISYGDRVGMYPSLDLDSADRPHIAYYIESVNALWYANWDGSFWNNLPILPTEPGMYPSLVVDADHNDEKYIAHYNAVNKTLEYAVYVGGGGNCGYYGGEMDFLWQCDEMETLSTYTDIPIGISMAVDKAGTPMIAYQSGGSVLKIARPAAALGLLHGNCGPIPSLFYSWQCDTLRLGVFGVTLGDYISLAYNSAGLPTIAYYGGTTSNPGNLYVAHQQFRVFLPFTVED